MYGGNCTSAYFESALRLKDALRDGAVEHDWLIGRNESLITRARNACVATFLETDYQKLLFIDADIQFTPDDVAELWNMQEKVAVGIYAMKRPDKQWYAAWIDGELVHDLPDEVVEVDYAGTGFMMIDRLVFEEMKDSVPVYKASKPDESGLRDEHAFFDCEVSEGVYWSEDYLFCKRWKALGGKVMANPAVKLKHWGSYAYGS